MHKIFLGLALLSAVSLAACGGGGSSGGTTLIPVPKQTAPPATSDSTLPKQATISGQTIWTTQSGLPLYVFNGDTAGVSNCTGSCAAIWPPLMSGAGSKATGDFTIIARSNPSGSQWAYIGKPLYTFASDQPGQAPTGNNFQGFTVALVAGQNGAPPPPAGCTGIYC